MVCGFAGYYVNSDTVPKVLSWLPRASLIRHAFEALCVNEFRGLSFEPSAPPAVGDALVGEQVSSRCSQAANIERRQYALI